MKYLLMCCFDEKAWESLPAPRRDDIMRKYQEFEQGLMKQGAYLAGAKLGSGATATTVRMRNGKPSITDGPFAETKEAIGGYHLIECHNLDEAITIAKRIPTLPVGGTIEVRPVEFTVEPT